MCSTGAACSTRSCLRTTCVPPMKRTKRKISRAREARRQGCVAVAAGSYLLTSLRFSGRRYTSACGLSIGIGYASHRSASSATSARCCAARVHRSGSHQIVTTFLPNVAPCASVRWSTVLRRLRWYGHSARSNARTLIKPNCVRRGGPKTVRRCAKSAGGPLSPPEGTPRCALAPVNKRLTDSGGRDPATSHRPLKSRRHRPRVTGGFSLPMERSPPVPQANNDFTDKKTHFLKGDCHARRRRERGDGAGLAGLQAGRSLREPLQDHVVDLD